MFTLHNKIRPAPGIFRTRHEGGRIKLSPGMVRGREVLLEGHLGLLSDKGEGEKEKGSGDLFSRMSTIRGRLSVS